MMAKSTTMLKSLRLILLLSCSITISSTADTFTSLIHLVESIQAEHDILQHLNNYILAERARLDELEVLIGKIEEHHKNISSVHIEKHVSNPVNAFIVTKAMHDMINKTTHLTDAVSKKNTEDFMTVSADTLSRLPSKDDMDGAVLAMLRLQDTYELDTSRLSDSNLGLSNPEDEAPSLTGDDCFKIGTTAHYMDDFYHSITWLYKALEKYDYQAAAGQNMTESIASLLDFLNFGVYKQGNIERALALAERWIQLIPGAEPGTTNIKHYKRMLDEKNITYDEANLPPLINLQVRSGFSETADYKLYEKLCQGKPPPPELATNKTLECLHEPILYSYYPAKVEVLSYSPRLVYFHHVISDSEIDLIKRLAHPKLDRSGVFASNEDTPPGGVKTHTRTSKSAWLHDTEDERILSLSRRFSRVSGLTIEYAEALQVLNYGIGGHYDPHCDFARADNPNVFAQGAGNRIATFILYLTDVEKGGATAFPKAGAAVWPEKGGAAFWYNLKSDGSLDERTLHGACPVLAGYKWVCNKWFHESGNEFTRRCPTQIDPDE